MYLYSVPKFVAFTVLYTTKWHIL